MKRIEMLTDVKDPSGLFRKGEIRVVEPEQAGYFCGLGWAKDLGGELATGTPDTSPKTLEVQNGKHASKVSTPGVE